MSASVFPHRRLRTVAGAIVLSALAAAAVVVSLPEKRPVVTADGLSRDVSRLPGVDGCLSLEFDGIDYTGQQAARIVSVDFALGESAARDTLFESMKAAGAIILDAVDVYHKIVVTGYRRPLDFREGLPFAARAVWLAPELVQPLEGWIVIRLPDGPRPPEGAVDGIYRRPVDVAVDSQVLAVTLDYETERRGRPTADLKEFLAAPLLDSLDHDNVFSRAPELCAISVTVLKRGLPVGTLRMSREAYEATDVSGLRARLAAEVLEISAKEMEYAEKYDQAGLFSPLLLDAVVSDEDKAAIEALEEHRRRAEDDFYRALFERGETGTAEAD